MWIINWALQIHCNPRVSLGANKLVSTSWLKTDDRVKRDMQFDIAFVFWVKILLVLLKLSNFFSLNPVPRKSEIICCWFRTMKSDWIWRKVFENFITTLNVPVDIIGLLFFQLVSILEKPHAKFKSFFIEDSKIR